MDVGIVEAIYVMDEEVEFEESPMLDEVVAPTIRGCCSCRKQ